MPGLILIIINSFIFYNLIYRRVRETVGARLREAYIIFLLAATMFIYVSTELFSLFDLINSSSFITLQICVLICGLYFSYGKFHFDRITLIRSDKIILGSLILLIIIPILITSFFYAPNNWDANTCWLARVENWIYNGNVNYYPTNFDLQNSHQPLSSFIFLFVRLLTKSDYFLNIIQFFFLVGIASGVSLITSLFCQKRTAQLISFIVSLTLSSAILQSNVTKNDLIVSFYFIAFVYYGYKITSGSMNLNSLLFFSAGLSFSMLTKLSVLPFIMVFFVYFLIITLRRYEPVKILYAAITVLVLFLFTNGPYYIRNYTYYNNLFGNTEYKADRDVVDEMKGKSDAGIIRKSASVVSKYIGWQFSTPFRSWNRYNEILIEKFHSKVLKLDINETSHAEYKLLTLNFQEDIANNLLYNIVLVISVIIAFIKKQVLTRQSGLLMLCLASFILFTLVFPVWDTARGRYLLPLFFVSIVFSSIMLSFLNDFIIKTGIYIFIFAGFINLAMCSGRPLLNIKYLNNHIKSALKILPNRLSNTFLIDSLVINDQGCPITVAYNKENEKWTLKPTVPEDDKMLVYRYLRDNGIYHSGKYFDRKNSYLVNDPKFYSLLDTIKSHNLKKIALFTSPDFLEYTLWVKLKVDKGEYKIRSIKDKLFTDYDCIIVFEKETDLNIVNEFNVLDFGKYKLCITKKI